MSLVGEILPVDPMERMRKSRLPEEEHRQVFRDQVLNSSGFPQAQKVDESSQPKVIILAGQPGAGKGNLTAAAQSELASKGGAVTIDPDELRRFHTNVETFREKSPYTWADDTQLDASAWAKSLRDEAINGRKNVILDTTLGEQQKAIELVEMFQKKGYAVEIRAMAVPQSESELGVDKRFTDGLVREGFGRYVPEKLRDDVYKNLPSVLDAVHDESLKPESRFKEAIKISVYDRGSFEADRLHPTPRYSQIATEARDDKPGQAMDKVRTDRMNDPQVASQLRDGWAAQKDWHAKLETNLPTFDKVKQDSRAPLLQELALEKVADSVNRRFEEAERHLSSVKERQSPSESPSQPKNELLERVQNMRESMQSGHSVSVSDIHGLVDPVQGAQLHSQSQSAVDLQQTLSKPSPDRSQTPEVHVTPETPKDQSNVRK